MFSVVAGLSPSPKAQLLSLGGDSWLEFMIGVSGPVQARAWRWVVPGVCVEPLDVVAPDGEREGRWSVASADAAIDLAMA